MTNDFHIYRMKRQHQRLSQMIEYEAGRPAPDSTRLRELKRRKLALKDRLTVLESQPLPH